MKKKTLLKKLLFMSLLQSFIMSECKQNMTADTIDIRLQNYETITCINIFTKAICFIQMFLMSRRIREVKMNYFGLISFHDLNLDNPEIGMSNVPSNLTGCTRKPQMYFWSFGIERVRIRMWKGHQIINYCYWFNWYRMSLFFSKQNRFGATWLAFPLLFL